MELLTVPEVAKTLRLGRSTVYLMCERGELPVIRIGTSIRIPASELDRWIRSQTTSPDVGRSSTVQ